MPRPYFPRVARVGRAFASFRPPAGVWLLASACGPGVATPMPEPPSAVFDLGGVDNGIVPGAQPATSSSGKYVNGAPGTVPAGSTVRITNLDETTMVFAKTAEPDGSFVGIVFAQPGDELRFEWTKDGVHSEPADGIVIEKAPTETSIGVRPSARFDCVKLEPGYALDFARENQRLLTVQNDCATPVTLASPRPRLGLTDFQLNSALPLEVAAGDSAALDFGFTRTADALREDVWFVDVTLSAETIRYPITLRTE